MGGKIFQPSAQLLGFRSGRGWGGHQEDLLSWGSAPCPCWEEYQVEKPSGGHWDLRALAEEWWLPRGQGPSERVSSCGLWICPVSKGLQAPGSQGAGAQGSWVQLGLTQRVTPAESLPLGRLPASVSSGRAGSWEQGLAGNKKLVLHLWTPRQASPICQMEAASCPSQPKMLNTRGGVGGALGTIFPGNLVIKW